MNTKTVYSVMTNTDLTEGRGYEYVLYTCEHLVTAERLGKGRYVQGGDCPILKKIGYEHDGVWYYPVSIETPSEQDCIEINKREDKIRQDALRRAVYDKALSLGLTSDELELLNGHEWLES